MPNVKEEKKNVGIVIKTPQKYDRLLKVLLKGRENLLRENTLQFANLQPGEKVLDIGCGTGLLSIMAKSKVGEKGTIIGIDASKEMVEYASNRAKEQQISVQFETGIMQALQFEANSFDVVFCSLVLHHIPKPLRLKGIQECFRILKPNGRLILLEFKPPQKRIQRFLWFFIVGHMIFEKSEQFIIFLQNGGFSNILIEKTDWNVLMLTKCEKK